MHFLREFWTHKWQISSLAIHTCLCLCANGYVSSLPNRRIINLSFTKNRVCFWTWSLIVFKFVCIKTFWNTGPYQPFCFPVLVTIPGPKLIKWNFFKFLRPGWFQSLAVKNNTFYSLGKLFKSKKRLYQQNGPVYGQLNLKIEMVVVSLFLELQLQYLYIFII